MYDGLPVRRGFSTDWKSVVRKLFLHASLDFAVLSLRHYLGTFTMLTDLRIQGYRGLADLTIEQLGRINLFVGNNNCGKSCVLEAIHLLMNANDSGTLEDIAVRRGDTISVIHRDRPEIYESKHFDCRHFFYGRNLNARSTFTIDASSGIDIRRTMSASFNTGDEIVRMQSSPSFSESGMSVKHHTGELQLTWPNGQLFYPGNSDGYMNFEFSGGFEFGNRELHRPASLLSTRGMSIDELTSKLSAILMTEDEPRVVAALQAIDSSIQRVAPSVDRYAHSIVVNCANQPPRIPLRSLGDGVYRMLGLALGLVAARDRILLIDEIDTGLHYTVMEKMWKLVFETSRELNVQVFATTHSRDCVDALASIARDNVFEGSDVMIHRIESGKTKSVAYSEADITAVAEFGNEVR